MKKQPKQTRFCSSGSHPITHNPQSCRGYSKDWLFPSLAVWVRACGNSYFVGLLQLQFLWSFKEVTEKPPAGLFHERSKGISRVCSWCCLRDTHPCGVLPGMGWPLPRSHLDHFLKGWGLPSRWQGGGRHPDPGGVLCNPITWAGPLAKTDRRRYPNIYSPSWASMRVCTMERN